MFTNSNGKILNNKRLTNNTNHCCIIM